MENPYYEQFKLVEETNSHKGQQWFGDRQRLVEHYGWAIPSEKVIKYMAECFDDIADVGAGEGYWASLLSEQGVNVKAVDPDSGSKWYNVENALAEDISHYIKDSPTLLVWPPVNDDLAARVLQYEPSHMLYVGEPRGGVTANDEFFDLLDKRYGCVKKMDIPSFAGVDDKFYHLVRKL